MAIEMNKGAGERRDIDVGVFIALIVYTLHQYTRNKCSNEGKLKSLFVRVVYRGATRVRVLRVTD